jgi:hypothetical protein
MKQLFACCLLFLSSMSFAQYELYPNDQGWFWIQGKSVTLAYSHLNAPANVSQTTMLGVLARMEAAIDGLNIPGLTVQVDTNVKATGCASADRNMTVICWGAVTTGSGNFTSTGGIDSSLNVWREGRITLDNVLTVWTDADMIYAQAMHQLLHVVGFQHPSSGTSVLNGAADLTAVDVAGLQAKYGANGCTLTYDSSKNIVIPYVTYRGNAYKVTIHHNGGASFSLVPGTVSQYGGTNIPLTHCQNLAVDGNNQIRFDSVNVNGAIYWGEMTLANGALTLTASGRK